jgi:magnesium transporter
MRSTMVSKRSKKAGLPPGTPVHIGLRRREKIKITILDYDEHRFQEKEVAEVEECFPFKEETTVTWINVEGLHQVETIKKMGDFFGLHPLVLEDILNTEQRPKIEDYGDYLYIVVKMLTHDEATGEVATEQLSLILGQNFVISLQEGREGDLFDPIRERIRTVKGRIRKAGADYLAYSLLDSIVDNYFVIQEILGERIELLEDELVTNPIQETLQEIHHMKREMIFLRRSVWPLREVISVLERRESHLINETTGVYLRDVYDHTVQVIETIETLREMLSEMLDIYLSSISNKLNAVMKVLTIIATIFMPLTFIAGIYGMNFKFMPELEWRWGYFALWGIVIVIAVSMVMYFKKKNWL